MGAHVESTHHASNWLLQNGEVDVVGQLVGFLLEIGPSSGAFEQEHRIIHCLLDIYEVSLVVALGIFDHQGIKVKAFASRGDDYQKDPMVTAYVGEKEALIHTRRCIKKKFR